MSETNERTTLNRRALLGTGLGVVGAVAAPRLLGLTHRTPRPVTGSGVLAWAAI